MWSPILLALILSSADLSDVGPTAPPEAWQAMKDIAEWLELYSPGGAWSENFGQDLRWCQSWAARLRDSPPLADHCWLPPKAAIEAALDFNGEHQAWLDHRGRSRSGCWRTEDWMEEARRLGEIWELARQSTNPTRQWYYRREDLARLRDLIGREAYYRGEMPPSVPVWRFAEIRD